jgi:hypothetical protein
MNPGWIQVRWHTGTARHSILRPVSSWPEEASACRQAAVPLRKPRQMALTDKPRRASAHPAQPKSDLGQARVVSESVRPLQSVAALARARVAGNGSPPHTSPQRRRNASARPSRQRAPMPALATKRSGPAQRKWTKAEGSCARTATVPCPVRLARSVPCPVLRLAQSVAPNRQPRVPGGF